MRVSSLILFSFVISSQIFASEESVKEKARESINDSKRAIKQAHRDFEDKTCELVNGKMVCALKKVKHSVEKSTDKVQDAAD
jgi:uncharacterized protein YjbJ (UPF0337 family)